MKLATIFDVQRYSTHDGPGIRTNVFLKGCPLRCEWCSNPESQEKSVEILFDVKRCILCRSCLDPRFGGAMKEVDGRVVPDRTRPVPVGLAKVCPTQAIRLAGRGADVESLVAEVSKDALFFGKSGGGVTFSGGEPLDQVEFLVACIERLEALGIGVAIETCLAVEPENVAAMLAHRVEWLVDVKHVDEEKFLLQTGGHVSQPLENLRAVARSTAAVTFRIPLIPGFNDTDAERQNIFDFIAALERPGPGAPRVDILPYHDLAAGKYHQLGRPNPYTRKLLGKGVLDAWRKAALDRGFEISIGG
jgi:pyruvate formate lyase activating enzyme